MKTYNVKYNGNSARLSSLSETVSASSEREAVIKVYASTMDYNYFPQEDGTVQDLDGEVICNLSDESIWFDGGYFYAEEV